MALFSEMMDDASEKDAEISRLHDALVMIENRLECALMGDTVCKGCVDVAHSYAVEALKPST